MTIRITELDAIRLGIPEVPKAAFKPSKYKNVKQSDGTGSKRESRRLCTLRQMEQAGIISNLRTQVKYELVPKQRRSDGKCERAVVYIADFVYNRDGKEVVEDSKGFRTADYVLKRKLMLFVHGVSLLET